jgi:hypothetical protein
MKTKHIRIAPDNLIDREMERYSSPCFANT